MSRQTASKVGVSPRASRSIREMPSRDGNGPAHDRRYAIALEMAHEQIGGGGQIRDRARAFRRHAVPQPLADRLTAYAEETGHLGLAQSPHRERAGEGSSRALPVEAFGEGVEPRAFVLVRSEYLLGRLFRPEPPRAMTALMFRSPIRRPRPCVNRYRMSTFSSRMLLSSPVLKSRAVPRGPCPKAGPWSPDS